MSLRFSRSPQNIAVAFALVAALSAAAAMGGERTSTTTRTTSSELNPGHFTFYYSTTKSSDRGADLEYAIIDPLQPDVDAIPDGPSRERIHRDISDSPTSILWFRQNGRSYLVRDVELVAAGRSLCEPVLWLQQAQGDVGKGEGEVGSERGITAQRLQKLGEQLGELSLKGANSRRRKAEASDLEIERRRLEDERASLLEGQAQLARDSQSLENRRQAIGSQQSDLVKRISDEMARLLAEARTRGRAELVKS
jgi:hypothetical protein